MSEGPCRASSYIQSAVHHASRELQYLGTRGVGTANPVIMTTEDTQLLITSPGVFPVTSLSRTTHSPLTMTSEMPIGNCFGSSNVARLRTVVGSKTTRSATIPGRISPLL